MRVNAFAVEKYPSQPIHQYDVMIGDGAEAPAVIKKLWNTKARRNATGELFIFDGRKLGWCAQDYKQDVRVTIDLDAEEGRPPGKRSNKFTLLIRKTKTLNMAVIQAYLNGQMAMSAEVMEGVGFLDHLLREGPSRNKRFIPVRRQFFVRDGQRQSLGGGVEVFRGVYQSLRLAEGKRCIVNLDVANCCFWSPTTLVAAVIAKMKLRDAQGIVQECRPKPDNGTTKSSNFHKLLAKTFRKVTVKAVYPGNPYPDKVWTIKDFSVKTPGQEKIEMRGEDGKPNGQKKTIAQYFMHKYNVSLQYPNLPLVEMTKKNVSYPMEFLHVLENQRYMFKLDEFQTANMIKFAVSRPQERNNAINEGKSWLTWEREEILKRYGLQVNPNMIKTRARLLPPPEVQFGSNTAKPGFDGRWNLANKRFLMPNTSELLSWGIGYFGRPDQNLLGKFAQDFSNAYRGHGGKVANAKPYMMNLPNDAADAVTNLYQNTGNHFKQRPQILVFIVENKNAFHYLRIKKSCDCRYGVVSQVLQQQQVRKGNAQYYSNVLMKFNAKLGGTTAQVKPNPTSGFKKFVIPTAIIGADVSHASPGSEQASMAALTLSFDRIGARYAATCQTNGRREEMIAEANWHSMLTPLLRQWCSNVGGGRAPQHVMYFRDGVSEGQFIHVMEQEVKHIKAVLDIVNGTKWDGKLTVVIAGKRHHVRAFPEKADADRFGNPKPGTLIERDATVPFEFDFYLYPHIALQGTSRPVHYTVLYDSAKMSPNLLQGMIYDHCYQYMRSTTSVSLFPAVYYAHLASNRAKAHEHAPASEGPKSGPGFKQNQPVDESGTGEAEVKALLPLYGTTVQFAMWYI